MNAWSFGIFLIVPASLILGYVAQGPFVWATVLLVFGVTPVLDAVLGLDTDNPDDDDVARRAKNPLYDAWLYLVIPLELGLLGVGLVLIPTLPPFEAVGLTVSLGLHTGALAINVAHELMHRPQRLPQAAAELLMQCAAYPHFCIEHVLGHHKNVATPDDPACSRRGQNVYAYLPQTLWGGLRSAWALETARVRRTGRARTWQDRRLRMPVCLMLVLTGIALGLGPAALLVFVAQAVVAMLLLEVINYIEHYGLRRQRRPDGRYERVLPRHSWNSAHRLSGRYLFQLPRHADHHHLASRPYYALRHIEDSPQMPAGYGTMVLVALVPPLWFAIMDPRLDAWTQHVEVVPVDAPPPEPIGA